MTPPTVVDAGTDRAIARLDEPAPDPIVVELAARLRAAYVEIRTLASLVAVADQYAAAEATRLGMRPADPWRRTGDVAAGDTEYYALGVQLAAARRYAAGQPAGPGAVYRVSSREPEPPNLRETYGEDPSGAADTLPPPELRETDTAVAARFRIPAGGA